MASLSNIPSSPAHVQPSDLQSGMDLSFTTQQIGSPLFRAPFVGYLNDAESMGSPVFGYLSTCEFATPGVTAP
jgi:hypothetical protein